MSDMERKENVHDEGEEFAKNAVLLPSTSLPADTITVKGDTVIFPYIFLINYCYYYHINDNNIKILSIYRL